MADCGGSRERTTRRRRKREEAKRRGRKKKEATRTTTTTNLDLSNGSRPPHRFLHPFDATHAKRRRHADAHFRSRSSTPSQRLPATNALLAPRPGPFSHSSPITPASSSSCPQEKVDAATLPTPSLLLTRKRRGSAAATTTAATSHQRIVIQPTQKPETAAGRLL